MYNHLKPIGKYAHPTNPPPNYKKLNSLGFKTFEITGIHLFPLANVQTKIAINFTQSLTPFTVEERAQIYKNLHKTIK